MKKDILVSVDIQPYYDGSLEIIEQAIEKINNTTQPTIILFNGTDVCEDTKDDVIGYYLENGLMEHRLEQMKFIEKDYAFFRDWMDAGVQDETIIKMIQKLQQDNKTNIQAYNFEEWLHICQEMPECPQLPELYEQAFYLPSWNTKLLDTNDSFELIGGGYHECLKEVALYLKAQNKDFAINKRITYGREQPQKNKRKGYRF